jgi:hypothetical protein
MTKLEILKQQLSGPSKKEGIEELKRTYEQAATIRKLARLYNTNEKIISSILKDNNIKIGNYKHRRKYSLNENIFNNLSSPEAAYWFGFLLADGYVNKNRYIGLEIKDLEHLEKFKNAINSTAPIYKRIVRNSKRNVKWKDSVIYIIHISSVKLINAVKSIGMIENKSQREIFPNIDNNTLNIFCRGYFDGDGGFSKCKGQTTINIRGSKDFLEKYLDILVKNCLLTSNNKKISFDCGAHKLQFNGNNVSKRIVKWLYKDIIIENNGLYLNRKYEIAKQFMDIT